MMNTRTILNGAALILGLAATGASFAQVAPNVDRSQITQEQRAEARASRGQAGSTQGQGKGTMARDGSGTGGQYGKAGGQGGGGRGKGR